VINSRLVFFPLVLVLVLLLENNPSDRMDGTDLSLCFSSCQLCGQCLRQAAIRERGTAAADALVDALLPIVPGDQRAGAGDQQAEYQVAPERAEKIAPSYQLIILHHAVFSIIDPALPVSISPNGACAASHGRKPVG
jgi:hypothetical protein